MESPQVTSDFFRLLKKLGVTGVERLMQALEEQGHHWEAKCHLEARIAFLEQRAQDLEFLNRQYRALLQAGGLPAKPLGGAVVGEDLAISTRVPTSGEVSLVVAAAMPPGATEVVARGWGPVAANEKRAMATDTSHREDDRSSSSGSPFPRPAEPKGWGLGSAVTSRSAQDPSSGPRLAEKAAQA